MFVRKGRGRLQNSYFWISAFAKAPKKNWECNTPCLLYHLPQLPREEITPQKELANSENLGESLRDDSGAGSCRVMSLTLEIRNWWKVQNLAELLVENLSPSHTPKSDDLCSYDLHKTVTMLGWASQGDQHNFQEGILKRDKKCFVWYHGSGAC